MDSQKAAHIFEILETCCPHPTTALQFSSDFELLIAVMLSAQATDVGVNKATPALFKVADTPAKMAALGEEGLIAFIKTIGLYRSKARHVIQTCKILVNEFNSEVPRTREALTALPGVGRKTANVVLNTAFGEPTIAVDTHVFRVANRTGLAHGKTPLAVELGLVDIIPPRYLKDAHHWLILHGRNTCTARKPQCTVCPIRQYCENPVFP